ncbi:MAG: hypothetical protein QM626_11110 [Microbacterium sp.]|uniref:hypothetical protein n=1 Tax=Microbacterium sp. TaxID=51671 RepID=UPI0039E4DFFC
MRRYLFGTGLLSALLSGVSLLRGLRKSDEPATWRTALAWLSWGITLSLAVGAVVDTYRASRGHLVASDSPVAGREQKLLRRRLDR